MRILSLNTWGGRLHDRLIPCLAEANADVLCLQKMVRTPKAETEWLIYRDHGGELLQRANPFGEVSDALPEHRAIFCPAARGELFDGERPVASEWGLATFIRDTYPVIGQAQDFIHGDFAPDGWGAHPRARNAHAVRLFDDSGGPITIVHLHGLRDLSGKHDTSARDTQTKALTDLITRLARENERLVVCGDFNLLPESAAFTALARLGLTDLVTTRGHADTRTSYYEKQPRFADYLLVTANVAVRHFAVPAIPEVSDHRALVLDIA